MTESKQQPVTLGDVWRATGGELTGDHHAEVQDITHDSRQVRPGSLFVAVQGANVDANSFVEQALAHGAVGVISEKEMPADPTKGAWLRVCNARKALAEAAVEVFHHPSRELGLVGITGTNGKTTTAYLIHWIAEAHGEPSALLSTVEARIGGMRFKSEHTTPEASDTARLLRGAVQAGCRTAVMECSSHAIDLHRCDALSFRVAVFTNLTPEHLDYHGTLEEYFAVKRRLFDGSLGTRPQTAVVNIDDKRGRELFDQLRHSNQHVVSYGIEEAAEVRADDIQASLKGTQFQLHTPSGARRSVDSPLIGKPHVYNILAAIATTLALEYELDDVINAVERCTGAPGRFDPVRHTGDFAVVVDYAHTNDALAKVLTTARQITQGRIITVFGCGGDRDRTKRRPMGETAGRLSDVVIVTSDNPRTEDPDRIIEEIEIGLRRAGKPYIKLSDRRAAIRRAIEEARSGDIVLIAGKGHEDYQIAGTETIHFDDKEVAREALHAKSL